MARPRAHLAVALVGLLALRRSLAPPAQVAFLTGSVLVDGDHLVDYVLRRQTQQNWLVLPLHGWEYVAILTFVRWPRAVRSAAMAAGLGLALHLTLDQLTNRPAHFWQYSLTYRALRRFDGGRLGFARGDATWMQQPWWQWF